MSDDDLDRQLAARKKKKRSKPKVDDQQSEDERDYTYMELLTRAYDLHRVRHPEARETLLVPHARMGRMGRRSIVLNFRDICQRIHRTADLQAYIASETQADASVDASGGLVLRGRFTGDQVDTLLRAYMNAYVVCKTCRGTNTRLVNESRLRFLRCQACGGQRCVDG